MAFDKKKTVLWGIGLLLIAAGVFTAYTWLVLNWSYSRGERSGFVQKFSEKGWICKTWEGELTMVQMPVPSRRNSSSRSATRGPRKNNQVNG